MKASLLIVISLFACGISSLHAQWSPTLRTVEMDKPQMKVFLPKAELRTGRAVVICPGGSYLGHASGHEGYDWVPYFNRQGITAAVLLYTLPKGDRRKPIADAETAIRIMRDSAAVWGLHADQIGIMGSSAGGHLASTIATHSTGKAKPDFQILFYPVISMDATKGHLYTHNEFLGPKPTADEERQYSNQLQVSPATPRAFIATSDDDSGVSPAFNSAEYYIALHKAGVPASLFVYPKGEHGWGVLEAFPYHTNMLNDLASWLQSF